MNSSFTEHILERARQRQKKLEELNSTENIPSRKKSDIITSPKCNTSTENDSTNNEEGMISSSTPDKKIPRMPSIKETLETTKSPLKISSHLPGSPQPQLKTLNIQKENFNMEIKLISTDHVRVEVEIQDDEDGSDKENNGEDDNYASESGLREQAKYKLKKLGRLYSADENVGISSPIQNSEAYFHLQQNETTQESSKGANNSKLKKGLSKLADLAQNIREWEDDDKEKKSENSVPKVQNTEIGEKKSKKKEETKSVKQQERNVCAKSTVTSYNKPINSPLKKTPENGSAKKVVWDEGVIKTLESQGFTRTESNSRLVYNCNSPKKSTKLTPKSENKKNIPTSSEITSTVSEKSTKITPKLETRKNIPTISENTSEKSTKRSIESKINSGIESKKALFEKSPKTPPLKSESTKDPSLLSIADRKALFEKNKGEALIPKAAFAMSIPIQKDKKPVHKGNVASKFLKNIDGGQEQVKQNASEQNWVVLKKSTITNNECVQQKENIIDKGNIAKKFEALIENKMEKVNTMTSTQQEIELLRNRFNKNKDLNSDYEPKQPDKITNSSKREKTPPKTEITPKTPTKTTETEAKLSSEKSRSRRKSDSPQVTSVLESVKNIKLVKPKEGRLYPTLSDIEAATENETELQSSLENSMNDSYDMCDMGNTSFGREILEVVCKGQSARKRSLDQASTDSNGSDILDDLDEYFHVSKSDCSNGPTPPKKAFNDSGLKQCNSFHYKSFTSETTSPAKILTSPKTYLSPRESLNLPTHVVDGENVMPLKYTVSFYRRQQMENNSSAKKVLYQPAISEIDEKLNESETQDIVAEKIQFLSDEINKQQMIISQTSQALNLCNATMEFMGSTEQVEAEKLLLLATHRRQAALHEVQRLKIQKTLRPQDQHAQNLPLEKGSLTIKNIKLPLKREYVRALAAAGGKGHHVICLVKSGEQVVSSQLVSTVATSPHNPDNDLIIPGVIKLDNIYSDFAVTFEVYCLQAQEEILPHEVKYHINKKASNKLTPKKSKHDSRMVIPPKESPAGPQVVRSSTFALMGYVVFSIQTVNKTHFSLNNAPSMSPLEGRIDMKIDCELAVSSEHKGFLTMFQDVSGFGAWHRRWCVLRGDTLSYWKYPDQEKERSPIGSISLKNCITENLGPVSREICARMNTFLFEIMREPEVDDKESLTLYHKDNKTVIRHLLSADTKEERIKWCEAFNKALIAIRMWGKK
nr:anillin isoform X1 [Onthophagus taurus]